MKQTTPSADRNMDVVRDRLSDLIPKEACDLLEVSSGTGQHGAHCARVMGNLRWWPTEYDAARMSSISAYVADCPLSNFMMPQQLDVTDENWPEDVRPETVDVILNINMIHITPWQACKGLLRGGGRKLSVGGRLILYGPFRQRDVETAPSNEAFDVWLKNQNAAYGLRYLEDVAEEAARHDLQLSVVEEVPANNLMVVFSRRGV